MLMTISLERMDQDATLAINLLNCPLTDKIWTFFSMQEVWYVMYLAVAVEIILARGWKRGLLNMLAIILTIVACDQLGNVFKNYFCRLRPMFDPYMLENGIHIVAEKSGLYGFYSAHAANSVGFAVSSLIALRPSGKKRYEVYSVVICIWALLVSLSRVFVAKHFLGDIIVGAAFGVLFGTLFAVISNRIPLEKRSR